MVEALSKLTVRESELLSGKGRDQEAKAANRSGNRKTELERRGPTTELPTLKGG
jgi:hypothetical protein